jgi:hypothetical protein
MAARAANVLSTVGRAVCQAEAMQIDPQNVYRLLYHLRHAGALLVPRAWWRRALARMDLGALEAADRQRVDYYCRLREPFVLGPAAGVFRLDLLGGRSTYQLDLREVLRYFDPGVRVDVQFGDVTQVPATPALVKTRPVGAGNEAAVLMKFNAVRHFYFVRDRLAYEQKRDLLVWRGRAVQPHRQAFLERFYDHPLCDVGHYHKRHQDVPWVKPRLTVRQQLGYKFVLAIEGNDVASNLKWIMHSNSLCLMTPPRYESWFMEGRLQPGVHYVALRPDYADLEENLLYYRSHPEAARTIIAAAQRWVQPFLDPARERRVALAVMARYLELARSL